MFYRKKLPYAIAALLACSGAWGEESTHTAALSSAELETANVTLTAPVVVTATRQEQNSFDLPVSIDAVSGETIRDGQLQVNLSETANRVPGVVVNNRNNPAQDLAVQIRGFGARSAFGVRGVRLYADGIPMTMPDGQGQTGTFNLDTAKRVEYLRGPFSALYGNSSGGVVQIFTQDGPDDPTLSGGLTFGSYDTRRATLGFAGDNDGFNYVLNASTYRSDGYRDQSDTRRDTLHGKFGFRLGDATRLTLVATALNQPDNEDPQGLNARQLKQDRTQANPNSLKFDTRVNRRHEQVGATLEHDVTPDDTLRLMAYYGQRENEQYQSISIAAQRNDLNGGGVATIDREFWGTDLRWSHKGKLGEMPWNFTVGVNYDRMEDDRKGYENFVANVAFGSMPNVDCGATVGGKPVVCGVKGNLRRDETNTASNFDQYLQVAIDLTARLNVSAGVRHSRVSFDNKDRYVNINVYTEPGGALAQRTNPNDSGSVTFRKTTPVIGAVFKVTDTFNLYANAGESFETPTFVEMAYKSTGSGLNLDLKPAKSRQYEIGAKWMLGEGTLLNAALYRIDTDDEIVVLQQAGGRTVYQNVDSSERKGFELSLDSRLPYGFSAYLGYSYLDAEFTSAFKACKPFVGAQTTCLLSVPANIETIQSGADIPGTYKHTFFGELAWKYQPLGFSTALEVKANSQTFVAFKPEYGKADGYATVSWRGGFVQKVGHWKFSEFARIENLFDREYVGSVRVGDLNGSYYEPAPTRNWLLGINASYQF
ncbi:MAG: TonB-dependent receptor [Methylophilaceae bacterium]|nr:TonB-dependent receptor [Methylophilaceae bacterium]